MNSTAVRRSLRLAGCGVSHSACTATLISSQSGHRLNSGPRASISPVDIVAMQTDIFVQNGAKALPCAQWRAFALQAKTTGASANRTVQCVIAQKDYAADLLDVML